MYGELSLPLNAFKKHAKGKQRVMYRELGLSLTAIKKKKCKRVSRALFTGNSTYPKMHLKKWNATVKPSVLYREISLSLTAFKKKSATM